VSINVEMLNKINQINFYKSATYKVESW